MTRVSRKLHLRQRRYASSVLGAVLVEAIAGIVGGILIAAALNRRSTLLAILGMVLWVVSFEPLLKLSVGTALGVEYDYAYLYGGIEPRFKMKFGSYLSLAAWQRAILHSAGTLGSPLGALIAVWLYDELSTAAIITWIVFCLLVLINVIGLLSEIVGVRKLGAIRIPPGSATEMVAELRCWWRTRSDGRA